jgi:predicted MPP superfamily phosphohydrolase
MRYKLTLLFLILLNIFLIDSFFIEPYNIETSRHTIPIGAENKALETMRIIHLSDLHLLRIGKYEKRIIESVNKENADYIFITGDHVGYNQDFEVANRFFNSLESKHGLYFVFGNSDYSNMRTFFTAAKNEPLKPSITLLRNSSVEERLSTVRLTIAGLDDPISGYDKPHELAHLSQTPGFKILLAHAYTESVESLATHVGFDLVLTGHTHGGQINILPKRFVQSWRNMKEENFISFFAGLYQDNTTWVHVSRGIGTSYLPIRFRARPEITIFDFKEAE